MWRERIESLTAAAVFSPPAAGEVLRDAAETLGGPLPTPLVDLLLESNGVHGEYGLGLVWPIERIVEDNVLFRTSPEFAELYMPFDPLLFFADAGNGDQFAFVWRPRRDEIYAWDHEDDSRRWVAASLDQYLQRWLDGSMRL